MMLPEKNQARKPAKPARVVSMSSADVFSVDWDGRRTVIDISYGGIKRGILPQALRELEDSEVLERSDIQMIITERTLERRLSNAQMLKLEESDGIARLLRVLAHANDVFEDEALAEEWLRSPNPALNNEVPMQMARTDIGAREVEAVLTRIEYGVFG